MEILPDSPADFSNINQASQIQTTLLVKAQDQARNQMADIMASISANPPHLGQNINVRA
jgi:hypothetical protein